MTPHSTAMAKDTKKKVLLIDDEKLLLDLYSVKFLKSGFDVFSCTAAEEAIQALERGYEPDAILLDITMPGMSGYEFLERLARMRLPRHCLKIALTNEGQGGEVQRMMELGANAHLLKAKFTPAEVVAQVESLMKNPPK